MPPAQVPDFGARRSGGSGDLRHGNLTQILRYVRDHGASSRHDIARGCGLGISTMTDLIGELRSRRLVRELDPIRRPGAGRPTRPIAFDGEPWCVLGVHVNLDKVELRGEHRRRPRAVERDRARRPASTAAPEGYASICTSCCASQLERIPADQQLIAIEIGVGGRDRRRPDHGAAYADGLDWQDFDLGAAVAADPARGRHRRTPRSASATSASWPRSYASPGRAPAACQTPSRPISAAPGRSAAA